MRLTIKEFGGIAPRFPDLQIQVPLALDAANCTMERAQLRALNAPVVAFPTVPAASLSPVAVSLFHYKPADTDYLLSFGERTYCVQNPIPNDIYKRVYWLGSSGAIKYGSMADVLAGTGPYPAVTSGYLLGVPIPVEKPILARVPYDAAVADPETTDGKIPSYRAVTYCFVSQFGEYGGMYAPADGSALDVVKVYEGDKIKVTGMATAPAGNYAMGAGAKKAVFCTDPNGNWRLVSFLPLSYTEFQIDPFNMDYAPIATNSSYEVPPAGLQGIAMSPFGFMYGWKDSTLCFSGVLNFHSWNSDHQKSLPYKILGIVPSTQGAIIMTEGGAFAALGTDPSNIDVPPLANAPACVSIDSIVDMGGFAMYAADEGIVACDVNGGTLVTEDVILRSQFTDYNPSAIRGFRHRKNYIMVSPLLTAMLDPETTNAKLMPVTFPKAIRAGFSYKLDGCFYYMQTDARTVYRFDSEDDAAVSAFWKSPTMRADHRLQCRWVGIDGENLTKCRLVVLADGVDITAGGIVPEVYSQCVVSLPAYRPTTDYKVEVYLNGAAINHIQLATSMREITHE